MIIIVTRISVKKIKVMNFTVVADGRKGLNLSASSSPKLQRLGGFLLWILVDMLCDTVGKCCYDAAQNVMDCDVW